MTTAQAETGLKRGREYLIELYPKKVRVSGEYLGANRGYHAFRGRGIYIFVDQDAIRKSNGAITHDSTSSKHILWAGKEEVKPAPDPENRFSANNNLAKILESLGEKL